MKTKGILCSLGLLLHAPERFATCVGFAWRCKDCGTTGISEGELLRISDHVDPRRIYFSRPEDLTSMVRFYREFRG